MISYLCEYFDYSKMNFETHHDIYLPASQCWHVIYTLNFFIKKKRKKKRNLMSTLEIRDVLDGISKACSMIVYFYIWTLTWINIWRIEETTKYCENLRDLLLLLLLFIYWHLWDPALRCDDFMRKFGFFLYWPFHTYSSQFVLICFCVYIHILPLCCVPHLLIFLRYSLVLVILPVSTLLLFMPCFQNLAFPFLTPHRQKTPWYSACP